MSGLRERMNRLRGQSPAEAGQPAGAERASDSYEGQAVPTEHEPAIAGEEEQEVLSPHWQDMAVTLQRNEEGYFLLRRVIYSLDTLHGHHRIGQLAETARYLDAFHSPNDRGILPPVLQDNLLFLDLETTGLGVGAGNVPFMTGIAFVEDGCFVVEQALIRHPAEERAMLVYLKEKLPRYPYLVTYNGRTFDWPVLAGRFIMNGFGQIDYEPKHLDFLHPSRSIWRNTLTSCRLSHVEEERLGIKRKDDVPGSLAPALYFQFLSDGNPAPLAGVFHHNEWDMLALACLAIRFGCLLGGRLGTDVPVPEEPEELLRTGLWLERMGFANLAAPLFERLADLEESALSWCLPLAARDKKCGNWERAVVLWQKAANAAERSVIQSSEAHIELAMYNEHKVKNYAAALQYAESALELALRRLALQRGDLKRRAEVESIRKRTERIRKKLRRIER